MSDQDQTPPDPAPVSTVASNQRESLPCGCFRAVVIRPVPVYDPETGHPRLDEAGAIVTKQQEEIEEGYCPRHSQNMAELQQRQIALLAEGKNEEAFALMAGASPFAAIDAAIAEALPQLAPNGEIGRMLEAGYRPEAPPREYLTADEIAAFAPPTLHAFIMRLGGGGSCTCGAEFKGENSDEEFVVHAAAAREAARQ